MLEAVRRQVAAARGWPPGRRPRAPSVGKVLLWTPTEPVIESSDQFDELAAPYATLGFDQFVLHHPAQTGPVLAAT